MDSNNKLNNLEEMPQKDLIRHGVPVDAETLSQTDFNSQNLASEFYRRLVEYINSFDERLNQEYEVGIRLVSFDQVITFSVSDLGYYNPSLICFYGNTEDGTPVQLIQHVSQINFLLMALKRVDPSQPKRPIGFIVDEK